MDNPSGLLVSFPASTVVFDRKYSSDTEHWRHLPSILSMRLSAWISALTHPVTGAYPNGISPKQLDWLARNQIANARTIQVDSALTLLWKSSNHLGVMLWNEVKAGRVVRLHKACYLGASFLGLQESPENGQGNTKECIHKAHSIAKDDSATISKARNDVRKASACGIGTEKIALSSTALGEASDCSVCKRPMDDNGDCALLKCIECIHQSHIHCAYPDNTVPVNLLKRCPTAISNWRCYDCKRCHICGLNDDSSDGLLLCDGCDSGEHMGCQAPPLCSIPPAPWFCAKCRLENDAHLESTGDQIDTLLSSPSTWTIDESGAMEEKPEREESFPDFPINQSSPKFHERVQPSVSLSVPINLTSPPLSDEMLEVREQRRPSSNGSACSITRNVKPNGSRLGKRDSSGDWATISAPPPFRKRCRRTTIQTKGPSTTQRRRVGKRRGTGSSWLNDDGYDVGAQFHKEKDEPHLLPFLSQDLPLLNEEEMKTVKGAKFWSVDDTDAFLRHMGYEESAKAFKREEIDGAALLLLRRQDVLLSLGMKLGPALKTYTFIKFIQSTVRSS